MTQLQRDLRWWLTRLDEVREVSSTEYRALCPAHDDTDPSLQVSVDENDGTILVRCWSNNCSLGDIKLGARRRHVTSQRDSPRSSTISTQAVGGSPLEAWSDYTQVPRQIWEDLGVREDQGDEDGSEE